MTEKELKKDNSLNIVNIIAIERRRIAGEIDRGLKDLLTSVNAFISSIQGNIDKKDIDHCQTIFSKHLTRHKTIVDKLTPVKLNDTGLILAIEDLVAKTNKATNMRTKFHCNANNATRLPPEIEKNLYQITHEVINNSDLYNEASHSILQLNVSTKKHLLHT